MSDERLLPCPFCGGEAKWANALHNYIECKECDFETIWYDTEAEAIKIWNTRKPMERIVEKLEKELRLAEKDKEKALCDPLCHPSQFDFVKGYVMGMHNAIETVKGSGVDE